MMVAGTLMPLSDLRSVYELLLQDGVMGVKKEQRPSEQPELSGVSNLEVMHVMASLKSRGFVRETSAWKHLYYYITTQGVTYLRDYLI